MRLIILIIISILSLLTLTESSALALELRDPYTEVDLKAFCGGWNANKHFYEIPPFSDSTTWGAAGVVGTSSASVTTTGLRGTATSDLGYYEFPYEGVIAGSYMTLVNPFAVIPGPTFHGDYACIEIPVRLHGYMDDTVGSGHDPATWASWSTKHEVTASISIEGAVSDMEINWEIDKSGFYDITGILTGYVPVNMERLLIAQLTVETGASCNRYYDKNAASYAFLTLSYTGFSPDDVQIIWGMTPQIVPLPSALVLFATGLFALACRKRKLLK